MDKSYSGEKVSFFGRVGIAVRLLFNQAFAEQVLAGLRVLESQQGKSSAAVPITPAAAPERVHASGLLLMSALQREGRLIDFLQQDVAGFSDEEVGAAARVVHTGCNKVLKQYLEIEPALQDAEGAAITVPPGFDAQRIRLTGNVAGQPPFRGALKHHGWVVKQVRLPTASESLDPRVLAPAEVELT
jgi:hypothetical protein